MFCGLYTSFVGMMSLLLDLLSWLIIADQRGAVLLLGQCVFLVAYGPNIKKKNLVFVNESVTLVFQVNFWSCILVTWRFGKCEIKE